MQLILNTYGTMLSRENTMFRIAGGEQKQLVAVDKVDSILISKGTLVSADALMLAMENDIEVLFVNYAGQPRARLWNHKFGSIAKIRRQQLRFAESPEGWLWVKEQLIEKISNQLRLLERLQLQNPAQLSTEFWENGLRSLHDTRREITISRISKDLKRLENSLRGWEGSASRSYFRLLSLALPPTYQFSARSRPAQDMFNAALNYLYGILYVRVESALIKAGIDPYIGIFHADEYNKPVFCYDFIEPYRLWADETVVKSMQTYALRIEDFDIRPSGLWLGGSGKNHLVQAFLNHLDEIIEHRERRRSRSAHLQLDAHALAQSLLKNEHL